jgi:hypothetical protein
MNTPFTPVTVYCPVCARQYIEWYRSEDCVGKTRLWMPKVRCDICYSPSMSMQERANILRLMARRRQQCHKLYSADCDTTFLNIVHKQLLKNGYDCSYSHKPLDKSLHSAQATDYTDGRNPLLLQRSGAVGGVPGTGSAGGLDAPGSPGTGAG